MKSQDINIGDELNCYIWDINKFKKVKITNKYKDYKKTCWADYCFDVAFLENMESSIIGNEGFIAQAFNI